MRFFHQFRHKYNANPMKIDGINFPSIKQGSYYLGLKLKRDAGQISFFLREVPFHLIGGTRYVLDFLEFHTDGTVHFVDIKGFQTEVYKRKKKLVREQFGIEIEEK